MSNSNNNNYLKFPHRITKSGPFSRPLKFLLTDRGRFCVQIAAGVVTLGTSLAFALKETYYLEKYMNRFFRIYTDGFPLEVPENIEEKIDTCMDKGKVNTWESAQVKSLMVNGFDVRSFGSSKSRYYGYIGVPMNYLYESVNDIDKVNLKFGDKSIDWNSEYGQLLEKSLILTDDEKEFGLLKTVLELRNNNFNHGSLIPSVCIFAFCVATQKFNDKFGLYHKPRALRIFVYAIFGAITFGVYTIVTDIIRMSQDTKVDKTLAQLGPELCETGVRFYEKLMNKNIAYRELSGDHSTYTEKGNEVLGWHQFYKLALSTRKLYFKRMLEDARKKEAVDTEEIAEQGDKTDDKMKKMIVTQTFC